MNRSYSKLQKGFTLIELLVVIAVVALLMAIVLPALTGSKKSARRIVCAAHMKDIYLLMQNYASDYDDSIIQAQELMYAHSLQEALSIWNNVLRPYMGKKMANNPQELLDSANEEALWVCPEDKNPYPSGFKGCPHDFSLTSYALNGYYAPADPVAGTPERKLGPAGRYQFSKIRNPGMCLLLGETSYASQFYDAEHPNVTTWNLPMYAHHRLTSAFFHRKAMNMLYVDGHVEAKNGISCPQEVQYIPNGYSDGKFQFWPELRLQTAQENNSFWGPGYDK